MTTFPHPTTPDTRRTPPATATPLPSTFVVPTASPLLLRRLLPVFTLPAAPAGGFIRVGFEDNIYFSKGRLAKSNAEFVERAARISREADLEIASPGDVRKLFALKE